MFYNFCFVLISSILVCDSVFGQPLFEETGQSLGINHFVNGGSGVATFDYDNDGWEDIYFIGGGGEEDKLYRNLQGTGFEDVTLSSGIALLASYETHGVVAGDINNNGFKDLIVTTNDDGVILLKNLGTGFFQMQDDPAIPNDVGWAVPMALADVNNDGLLDLYVGYYIEQWGFLLDPQTGSILGFDNTGGSNRLYLNNGDFTFTDVTDDYGVGDTGCTYAAMFTDYDGDGDLDLMTSNDFGMWSSPSNRLYRNNYPIPSFTDVSTVTNMNIEVYGMGIAQGDFDKDQDLDYYFTNIDSNFLMVNDGVSFSDQAKMLGVVSDSSGGLSTTHYGCQFFDANNDSYLDLFVAAGGINTAGYQGIAVIENDSNRLFLNDGSGHFEDVTAQSNIGSVYSARGSAIFDYDMDGLMDVVVNHMTWVNPNGTVYDAESELFRNVSQGAGNWIKLKLNGTISNRDCIGCRATFWLEGEPTLMEVTAGSSHASQSSSILHFGLGPNSSVDSIQVRYISGVEQTVYQLQANQLVELTESLVTSSEPVNDKYQLYFTVMNEMIYVGAEEIDQDLAFRLHDCTGRLVWSGQVQSASGLTKVCETGHLNSGLYVLQATIIESKEPTSYVFVKN